MFIQYICCFENSYFIFKKFCTYLHIMEVAVEDDIIKSPLSHVTNLCNQDFTILHRLNDVGKYFRTKLNGNLSKIPCINHDSLENIPPNSLVCFRGMIQDMLDPEFYLGRYSVMNKSTKGSMLKFGCYTESAEKQNEEIDFESNSNVTLERQTYYCVPVPGENQWLKDMFISNSSYVAMKPAIIPTNKKRTHKNEGDNVNEEKSMDIDNFSPSVEKRSKSDDVIQNNGVGASRKKKDEGNKFDKNNPLPNENGTSCFISMYADISELKLNEVAEFIGILNVDPHDIRSINTDDEEMTPCDDQIDDMTNHAPPSQIPRLHCIFFNKFATLNPAINMKSDLYENTLKELSSVRNDLMQLLTNVFGGDASVAEYFLIHLISSTYAMVGTLCVGKFSLNITNCHGDKFPQLLYNLIEKVVEKSYYLPLTVENLNKMKFTPKKDYEANKLTSGILQLSSDTNLVLDETEMQPGKLDSDGLNNLKGVGNLMQWQNVEYDFKFSKVDMKTNVNVLVLSEGKSMLKCDCQIPIVAEEINNEQTELLIENISPILLEKTRIYLTTVRSLEYNLTDEVSKALEEDFVEMRKQDLKAMTAEAFSLLLSTARYMALSYGQSTLDAPLWTRAKDLDAERKKRST